MGNLVKSFFFLALSCTRNFFFLWRVHEGCYFLRVTAFLGSLNVCEFVFLAMVVSMNPQFFWYNCAYRMLFFFESLPTPFQSLNHPPLMGLGRQARKGLRLINLSIMVKVNSPHWKLKHPWHNVYLKYLHFCQSRECIVRKNNYFLD